VSSNIEDADNVGVIERGCGASFAKESLEREFVIFTFAGRKDFNRDLTVQFHMLAQIHSAHSAATKNIQHRVLTNAEAFVPPGEQLRALELRDEAGLHKYGGRFSRVFR
jgi:hypothetical protein